MLTRSQVARRLGKSVATVRRMEGIELHPVCDGRGVYRFDAGEVERLARAEQSGSARRRSRLHRFGLEALQTRPGGPDEEGDPEAPEEEAGEDQAQERARQTEAALEDERRRCRKLEAENAVLRGTFARVADWPASLNRRQVVGLGDQLDELIDLLDEAIGTELE
jgi:hypothetical protein